MNKVILIGNLTKAPECGKTDKGISFAKFSLAVGRKFNKEETDFFSVVAWRGLAELCFKYLDKGSKISVVGTIENRTYENKDGQKIKTYDIIADDIEFLTSKNKGVSNQENAAENKTAESNVSEITPAGVKQEYDADDMPF